MTGRFGFLGFLGGELYVLYRLQTGRSFSLDPYESKFTS